VPSLRHWAGHNPRPARLKQRDTVSMLPDIVGIIPKAPDRGDAGRPPSICSSKSLMPLDPPPSHRPALRTGQTRFRRLSISGSQIRRD
jgi:hypothetical protein